MSRIRKMPSAKNAALPMLMGPLALAAVLSGCAVGPDYVRPSAALPESYSASKTTGPQTESVTVDKAWWRLFNDKTLNELVEKALVANHDIATAVAKIEQVAGVARETSSALFPTISAEGSASRTKYTEEGAIPLGSTMPRIRSDKLVQLSTSFELDLWGKLRRADEAARANLLASEYARDTTTLSVASAVVNGYLTLRAADASLAVAQETLKTRQETLQLIEVRLKGGLDSPLIEQQALTALATAEAQVASLRAQRAQAETALALLTAEPNLTIAAGDVRQMPMPPVPPVGLPSQLLTVRPDVRQAEETLISANAQIGVARAAYFPSISLTGSLGNESAALANLWGAGAGIWSLGLATSMPIFDAGRTSARVDQATAVQKQSVIAYQKTLQTAFKEVKDALVGVREGAEADRAWRKGDEAATKSLTLAQARYKAGYIGYLDLLDTQRTANDAHLSAISARQAQLTAAVALFKALGGGWEDPHQAK